MGELGEAFKNAVRRYVSDLRMKRWGIFETTRRRAEELKQQPAPQPAKKEWARGSVEWQAEQDRMKSGPVPATPAEKL